MNEKRILLSSPHMSEEGFEQRYVKEAFDTNWIAPLGANVDGFENELADYVGINNAAALSSGTAAIHMALKAAGVEKDDIVICQSLTFSATANPIIYQNAIPVFVDSDWETWNMSPAHLRAALEKYPQAKAVLVVHLYGLSANLDEIVEICQEYGVTLIEDAAESLGTTYKDKFTGTFGKYGIYSFNGNKIITTSGGGMLVSNDQKKIEKVRFWSTQSRDKARHYQHSEMGFNYRMSNILAGIGRGQLKVLDKRIKKKNDIYNYYKEGLADIQEISFMPENGWNKPNFWLSVITLKTIKPQVLIDELDKANIEARPIWKPMHLQPFFEKYDFIGNNVSERLFMSGVCLPSDTKMSEKDLLRIVKEIKRVVADET
ncbi:aminotransferase class I/II-fold pyridoxal phosphate-dependent enzyme [Enterococcus innesii]|uniref:DegT/DnrJ/EryC1/StrS family aminotransferase n=1 Tax=Enterococcus innesii TaxID=2839759 RepID=UPI0035117CB3